MDENKGIPNSIPLTEGRQNQLIRFFNFNRNLILFIAAIAAVFVIGGFWLYYGYFLRTPEPPRKEFSQVYSLVQDKISQSAAIRVTLPEGILLSAAEAPKNITFDPPLKGEWSQGTNEREVVFKPSAKPETGKYYAIALSAGETNIQKDFFIDEDPRVAAIFPSNDSEAPEKSAVTVVFNRPMVPLTTLGELAKFDIPIEIIPATPGKFKWITTRNLQFIPEKRLQRSTNYAVNVRDGFVSVDGLPVSTLSHKFATRPLRYESAQIHHDGVTLYDEPVIIRFNQPVDLERTKEKILVKKTDKNERVEILVEYGKRGAYDPESKKTKDFIDRSVLMVYGKEDRHGRKKFWDLETNYTVTIAGAFPAEGDINLTEQRTASFRVPEIIAGLSADSPRSKLVEPGLFDPEGRLWVSFYDEIDKNSSGIKAQNLKETGYGEKCKRDEWGYEIRIGNECEKITDKRRIFLKFNPDGLTRSQEIRIEFRKIINTSGLLLNAETITKSITTYPKLVITRIIPENGTTTAKLTEMKICSTNPLMIAAEENFYEKVKSNISVGKWNWHSPFRIGAGYRHTPCAFGEFENTILYSLIPESFYKISLKFEDDFGQKSEKSAEFTTEKISFVYRNFDHLQKTFNVTTPNRTKLVYSVENLEYVNLHVCEVSALTMFRYMASESRPRNNISGINLSCESSASFKIDLPKKYWTRNYFQINLADFVGKNPLGHYVLSFSHPEYREERYDYTTRSYAPGSQIYERTFLTVTNLAVQEKKVERYDYAEQEKQITDAALARSGGNLYWVVESPGLNAALRARVDVYKNKFELGSTSFTDENGIARTPAVTNSIGAIITKGNDSAIVSDSFDKFQWASGARTAKRTYIYTDRPIYRPGQEVFIKGIHRIGYDGEYEFLPGKKADIEVFNSKGESILKKSLEISEYGTFETSIVLDAKAPLGYYRIRGLDGYGNFDVEEYSPAPFKLGVTSAKEEYIAGDNLSLDVDANYYFGVPVEGGGVEYSILAQDYYFDRYQDGYFRFGSGWYYSYDGRYGDKYILRGKTKLDEKGKAKIEERLDFNKFFKEEDGNISKIFVINITAKNTTGQSVSAQKSVIVHRGEFYVGVNLDKRYFSKSEKSKIRLKSADTKGEPISVEQINVEISKIKWEWFKRQEVDGRFYYRTEKKKTPVKNFNAGTDERGNFETEFSVDEEGEYEISVSSRDGRQNPITAVNDFYVYGSGAVTIKPTNNETLDLAVENNKLGVGDEASIIIKSPYDRAKALVATERGKIFDYEILDINSNLYNYKFKIREEYIPNVYFSAILLSPRPEVKFGQINFLINTREKELNISVKSDKNNYLPGEKVTLKVGVKDFKNEPVSTEISIAVADLSVLALKGNPKKNPVSFFYAGFPLAVTTASNIKNILYEAEIPLGTKGGGGMDPDDLAKKKRGEFKDTAYWRGTVVTGKDGKAEVSFNLPDNLTTWQTEIVGVTKNTELGTAYGEFTAKKDLMVVPLKPRFVIPGDEFMIGAKVFNQTSSGQKLNLSVSSPTLELKGEKSKELNLRAGETQTVYFAAKGPEYVQDGYHTFTVSAKNESHEDTVENSFPIKRNDTYEAVSTAHFTSENKAREFVFLPDNIVKDKGGVSVKTSATMAVFLSDALNYLVTYPYGCTEQIASKLSSIAIVKRGLGIKNLGDKFTLKEVEFNQRRYTIDDVANIGLARIYSSQSYDGGFHYYPRMKSDFYLTLHVVNTLMDLKKAGYGVDQNVLNRAAQYLYSRMTITAPPSIPGAYDYYDTVSDPNLSQDKNLVIMTAYALGRVSGFTPPNNLLEKRIKEILDDKKFIREDISNLSLAHLAMLLTKSFPASRKDEVFKTLENRITIDARGAFLTAYKNQWYWNYYETPAKDTALLLKAFVADKRDTPIRDKVIRWLLRSRAKDGAWGSTNSTVAVIDAFTDYLEWKRETESEFVLDISVGGKEKMTLEFNKDTILNTFDTFFPVSDFGFGKITPLDFSKTARNKLSNTFYYDMLLKYYLPIDTIPPRDEGFAITREFYRLDDKKGEDPVSEAGVGDVLRGHLTIVVPKDRNFASIEDFIPAGTEIVNLKLATEDKTLYDQKQQRPYYDDYYDDGGYYDGGRGSADKENSLSDIRGGGGNFIAGLAGSLKKSLGFITFGIFGKDDLDDDEYSPKQKAKSLYPDAEELHDDRIFLFKERLPAGVYEYDYFVRALIPGKFHHLPAVASEMYFPENFGRTEGEYFFVRQ